MYIKTKWPLKYKLLCFRKEKYTHDNKNYFKTFQMFSRKLYISTLLS